jgi:hypothetical protein
MVLLVNAPWIIPAVVDRLVEAILVRLLVTTWQRTLEPSRLPSSAAPRTWSIPAARERIASPVSREASACRSSSSGGAALQRRCTHARCSDQTACADLDPIVGACTRFGVVCVMDLCLCPIDLAATLHKAGFEWARGRDPMEWFVLPRSLSPPAERTNNERRF